MNVHTISEQIAKIEESLRVIKEQLPLSIEPNPARKKNTYLVVTMPDGQRIAHGIARHTFLEVIGKMGVERVLRCAPDLVSTREPEYTSRRIGSYYVLVGGKVGSTNAKKRHLLRIADALKIKLNIETVEHESENVAR